MLIPLTREKVKKRALVVATSVIAIVTGGCNSASNPDHQQIRIVSQVELPETLNETSGLACTETGLITLNDSGNDAVLFHLQFSGKIAHQQTIAKSNYDWEALAADKQYFYIGDVGNNRGNRTNLAVIKVDRNSGKVIATHPVSYAQNKPESNMPYMHNFDAEALAVKEDHLFLFSKSWNSKVAAVYQLSKSSENISLEPIAKVRNLPGVVTGATYDTVQQRFLLTGYINHPLGMFKPFVATLSADWEIQNVFSLTGFGQVEGICVTEKGEVWVTQEASTHDAAKLVNIALP